MMGLVTSTRISKEHLLLPLHALAGHVSDVVERLDVAQMDTNAQCEFHERSMTSRRAHVERADLDVAASILRARLGVPSPL